MDTTRRRFLAEASIAGAAAAALGAPALASASGTAARASGPGPAAAPPVLSLREQTALQHRWLAERFATVLPEVMRREQVDMWIVVCREHNEGPVYSTLVPAPSLFAWRLTMLVFFDRGTQGIERLILNPYGSGDLHKAFADFYTPAFEPAHLTPWERLAQVVRARGPKAIAIDESDTFAFADGLTASHKARLVEALGPEPSRRLVTGGRMAVGWLERRSAAELAFYPRIVALNHAIIAEAFSRSVITPGVTTIDDLAWWVRERIAGMKLGTWFQPMFYITRPAASDGKNPRVVEPGDMLRCDIGISYLGLTADIQQVAYVPRAGEPDAPTGLRDALAAGNRLQDILTSEMKAGAAGNAILAAALAKARAAGLAPRIYSHPIGHHGHAAGSRIGLPDMQDGVPGMGEYPAYPDVCWAIELSVRSRVPEWGGHEITMALEEDAVLTGNGVSYLDGRQTRFHLVR
jgi:Xaa-Pro aminopeptidase